MTIDLRPPKKSEEAQLRALFTEAFGDEAFTELFFAKGYAPQRCLVAADDQIRAAQYWFDCTLKGQKAAYLYGIAAFEACRGQGIGSKLVKGGLAHLRKLGYEAVLLVPAEPYLFGYYERFGFCTVSSIREERISAGAPIPLRKLTVSEYAVLRRKYLPENGIVQEGPCLNLLAGYARFYASDQTVLAVTEQTVWELLGDEADAPGILGALGIPEALVRTPGNGRPFAMGIGFDGPVYFGLALD